MKRNFDFVLKDLNGADLKQSADEVLTMKAVSITSLMGTHEADRNISGDEKLKRYLLAVKINAGGEVELTAEEIAQLKSLIGRAYGPIAVGPAFLFLEKD